MTATIQPSRTRRDTRGLLLKAAVVFPDVIISSLLWLMLIAALPPPAGFGVTVLGVTIAAVLAAGLG